MWLASRIDVRRADNGVLHCNGVLDLGEMLCCPPQRREAQERPLAHAQSGRAGLGKGSSSAMVCLMQQPSPSHDSSLTSETTGSGEASGT